MTVNFDLTGALTNVVSGLAVELIKLIIKKLAALSNKGNG